MHYSWLITMRIKPVFKELLQDDVSIEVAEGLQEKFKDNVKLRPLPVPTTVTGVDIAYQTTTSSGAVAVAVTMEIPTLKIIETGQIAGMTTFPYVPGLLGFRELNLVGRVLYSMEQPIEVVLYDGHGIAHPRFFGAASQLGVALGIPTIGCAKKLYHGKVEQTIGNEQFSCGHITDETTGEVIGVAMRMQEGVNPVYVSPGHMVDLESAISIVKSCAGGYRLPEPLRQADIIARKNVTFFED